jgi:hypothetical protein
MSKFIKFGPKTQMNGNRIINLFHRAEKDRILMVFKILKTQIKIIKLHNLDLAIIDLLLK